jgi:hypothetical protein
MSQFHLFPPTTAVPFSPFTSTPFQSPPSSIQQIPIQLQFQLAAWQTFRFRQHEQMLNALNMAKSQMANKDNRIEEADVVSIDAESASNDDQKGKNRKISRDSLNIFQLHLVQMPKTHHHLQMESTSLSL